MECLNCNTKYHYCPSCGEDGYSEYGFCKRTCQNEYQDNKCKHELVRCDECGKYIERNNNDN